MPIRFRLTALESTSGQVAELPTKGVTCIVGGNNVGKSQMLRDIDARVRVRNHDLTPVTLRAVSAERPVGSIEESEAWLESRWFPGSQLPGEARRFAAAPNTQGLSTADFSFWFPTPTSESDAYLGNIPDYFVRHASAGSLSQYAAGSIQAQSYGSSNDPLARLLRNGDLEDELSSLSRDVFGHELVLDRISPDIRLRVGTVKEPVPPLNRPTQAYADAVAALPSLDIQGDGFRSFIGLALLLLAERPDVLLVDEPEAFLHPGQARALGRWLAKRAVTHDHQIILASHDRDIVLGLIEGAANSAVTFIRLDRLDDSRTNITQLSPADVSQVWDQPALRYSNVVQGLFHRRVVMCEGDGDCRFYGAALDELAISTGQRSLADDVLFVPTGGKHGMPKMAASLTSLGVEARAILDFDVLRTKADIRACAQAMGADWSTFDSLYMEFIKAPNGSGSWDVLKHTGLAGVQPGPSYVAGQKLIESLSEIGLSIVPVGELEDFNKALNAHGPAWVTEALASNTHRFGAVADLVRPILSDLGQPDSVDRLDGDSRGSTSTSAS